MSTQRASSEKAYNEVLPNASTNTTDKLTTTRRKSEAKACQTGPLAFSTNQNAEQHEKSRSDVATQASESGVSSHYSLNFFHLPLEKMKIPKVWHPILRWQATFIVSTVYFGYGIMSLYIHEKQNDIWATSTMVILGLLTILFNSGRLIRMEKAENTLESKAIIIFNILSFSVRFFILKSYRGLLLPNGKLLYCNV